MDIGETEYQRDAAEKLLEGGRTEGALVWFRRNADAGDHEDMEKSLNLLRDAGRIEEALEWLQSDAGGDANYRLWMGGHLLREVGRQDEALNWFRRAAEGGLSWAFTSGAEVLAHTGRTVEAVDWYERAHEAGEDGALVWAANLLRSQGCIDDVLKMYERNAAVGTVAALRDYVVRMLLTQGGIDAAFEFYRREDVHGIGFPLLLATESLGTQRSDEAIAWLQMHAKEIGPTGESIVDLLRCVDNTLDKAHEYGSVDEGGGVPVGGPASGLPQDDHEEESLASLQARVKAGDWHAVEMVAERLRQDGDPEGSVYWHRRAAQAGHERSLGAVADLLHDSGRAEEAESLRRYGWEPDGSVARPWISPAPPARR